MARRRSGNTAGWSSKQYRSPAWKFFHPAKYLRSEYRKARRAMRPGKVFLRVTSLDEVAKLGRTQTRRVTEQSRRADLARAQKSAAKKVPAKKTAGKRVDPYAAALAIPAQNRAVAAKQAAAVKAARAPRKQVAKRKSDGSGQFDGSKVLNDRDRVAWQNAMNGTVDPSLAPRSARTRRTPGT